jgi:hypothetical protein
LQLTETEKAVFRMTGANMPDRSEKDVAGRVEVRSVGTGEVVRIAAALELKLRIEGDLWAANTALGARAEASRSFAKDLASGVEVALMAIGSAREVPEAQRKDAKEIYQRLRQARRSLGGQGSADLAVPRPDPPSGAAAEAPGAATEAGAGPAGTSRRAAATTVRRERSPAADEAQTRGRLKLALAASLLLAIAGMAFNAGSKPEVSPTEEVGNRVRDVLPVSRLTASDGVLHGTVSDGWQALSSGEKRAAVRKAMEILEMEDHRLFLYSPERISVAVALPGPEGPLVRLP